MNLPVVIDDFFPEEHFKKLQSMMLGPEMPWYYLPETNV